MRLLLCQNNYSLLCRADTELGTMPETVSRQNANVGFLAYSPLAGGCVSRHCVPFLHCLEDDLHPFLTVFRATTYAPAPSMLQDYGTIPFSRLVQPRQAFYVILGLLVYSSA